VRRLVSVSARENGVLKVISRTKDLVNASVNLENVHQILSGILKIAVVINKSVSLSSVLPLRPGIQLPASVFAQKLDKFVP
jgi:hypothetical protein